MNIFKLIIRVLCFMTFFIACKKQVKGIQNIDVIALHNTLKDNNSVQLLDVRTKKECEKGSIKNALQIDVTTDNFEQTAITKLNKTKPVYVFCRSGGRSLIASEILHKNGFKVYNVEGGYLDWLTKIEKK